MTSLEARNRSYWINRGSIPRGSVLVTTADTYSSGPIPAGSRITVSSVSNDGFNGMMVTGRYDGRLVVLSAGNLRPDAVR